MSRLLIPNTTQVPNIFLDKVMPLLPEAPLKVLLVIARFTYGFQKRSDRIGYGQLAKTTGLERRTVIRAVKFLGNLIHVKPGGPGKGPNEYSLNLDITEAQLLALNQRKNSVGSDSGVTSDRTDTSDFVGKEIVTPVSPFQTNISKPKREARKKPRSLISNSDFRIKNLFGFWAKQYQERVGSPYVFDGKDAALLKALLAHFSEDEIRAVMLRFLDSKDEWIRTKGGYTIGVFRSQFNKLTSTAAKANDMVAVKEMPL